MVNGKKTEYCILKDSFQVADNAYGKPEHLKYIP